MKESKDKPAAVHGREKVAVWGWPITNIPDVLPALVAASEMIVDVEAVPQPRILGLEVSIIGSCAGVRLEIVGYPVVQRHRISNGVVTVEIEAFLVEDVDKPAQSDSDPHLDISG